MECVPERRWRVRLRGGDPGLDGDREPLSFGNGQENSGQRSWFSQHGKTEGGEVWTSGQAGHQNWPCGGCCGAQWRGRWPTKPSGDRGTCPPSTQCAHTSPTLPARSRLPVSSHLFPLLTQMEQYIQLRFSLEMSGWEGEPEKTSPITNHAEYLV